MPPDKRIANIDLVRALAIILVLYYHVTQMLAGQILTNRTFFYFGHHGVTIFFVLSGFLIGGIYYKKENVNASKFWLSRFLRTYPPYLIMLVISWLAVYLNRKEQFDFGFLVLIQNFYTEIPYFLVSWSLAVEEHFYLLFALLITCISVRKDQIYFWISLAFIPALLRIIFYKNSGEFGFYKTASFLHIDSLATGVIIAYLVHVKKMVMMDKPWAWWTSITLMMFLLYFISKYENIYTWSVGHTLANFSIANLLLLSYYRNPLKIAKNKFISTTALMAYSLYLVHPLILHLSMAFFKKLKITNLSVQYIFTIASIYVTSYIFYILVEKKSIEIRDKILEKIKFKY